jgi:hypothetical protein
VFWCVEDALHRVFFHVIDVYWDLTVGVDCAAGSGSYLRGPTLFPHRRAKRSGVPLHRVSAAFAPGLPPPGASMGTNGSAATPLPLRQQLLPHGPRTSNGCQPVPRLCRRARSVGDMSSTESAVRHTASSTRTQDNGTSVARDNAPRRPDVTVTADCNAAGMLAIGLVSWSCRRFPVGSVSSVHHAVASPEPSRIACSMIGAGSTGTGWSRSRGTILARW